MNGKKKIQVNVGVEFTQGRGFGRIGEGLCKGFLTGNPEIVSGDKMHCAATIAALYNNPVVEHTNKYSRAIVTLALYASGVPVTFGKSEFRKLERTVREYQSIMRAPMYDGANNAEFAGYVLKKAVKRASSEGLFKGTNGGDGVTTVDFAMGRGYGNMGAGLPADFLKRDRLTVCATIAALYNQHVAERTNEFSRAMVMLALYAGGVSVTLTHEQFVGLRRTVREYLCVMRAEHFDGTNNRDFATYVLQHAGQRAATEKVS